MDAIRDVLAIPFGAALSLFYNLTDSYVVAIILLTVIIRFALLPASISQQKNSAKQVRLQTKVNKIKQKFPLLLVFLTGGDANIFDIREKSGIFAVKNLVITGLDCIYRYNEGKK